MLPKAGILSQMLAKTRFYHKCSRQPEKCQNENFGTNAGHNQTFVTNASQNRNFTTNAGKNENLVKNAGKTRICLQVPAETRISSQMLAITRNLTEMLAKTKIVSHTNNYHTTNYCHYNPNPAPKTVCKIQNCTIFRENRWVSATLS